MWNLFERIINAIKPCEKSQQPSDQSQSWDEANPEQPQSPQETADTTQQNQWQHSE